MAMSEHDLHKYSSPYPNWENEFASTLQEIEEFSGAQGELSLFLIEHILPYVEHQYTLYDCMLPAIDSISVLTSRNGTHLGDAMFFLQYVFRCHIRDSNQILVLPVPYSFLDSDVALISVGEQKLFDRAISYYTQFRGVERDIELRSYFDCVFLDRLDVQPDHEKTGLDTAVAIAMSRYKRGGSFCGEVGRIGPSQYDEIIVAIQGRTFPESELFALLESDISDECCWANGSIGVIAGVVLLFSSLQGDERQQRATLTKIVDACAQLKRLRSDDESDRVFSDQFLLEDIGSVLFRERLRATTPVDRHELTPLQRHYLSLLRTVYCGHTYSLLCAGVLPDDYLSSDISAIADIYSI
jgi:hypothetical protein